MGIDVKRNVQNKTKDYESVRHFFAIYTYRYSYTYIDIDITIRIDVVNHKRILLITFQ